MADQIPAPAKSIRVRALARGYFGGQIREPGDEFDIDSGADLGGWMMPTNKADQEKLASQLSSFVKKGMRPAPSSAKVTPAMRTK